MGSRHPAASDHRAFLPAAPLSRSPPDSPVIRRLMPMDQLFLAIDPNIRRSLGNYAFGTSQFRLVFSWYLRERPLVPHLPIGPGEL